MTTPFRLIISFGLCGGLDPALRSGDVVIGTRVLAGGTSVVADHGVARELAARLGAAGERVSLGAVAAVDAPILTRAAKAALRNATWRSESTWKARLRRASRRITRTPFAILRVVSDPADRDLPPIVAESCAVRRKH